jgi:protein-L-isoaspartate(D-aspartate) O-methyltransferase
MVTARWDEASPQLADRISGFADTLTASGLYQGDQCWRQALHEVPRHLFIPSAAWACPAAGPSRTIDRAADQADWWQMVYSDAAITTQVDDGATDPASGTGIPTSAASQPSLILDFLNLLGVHDGHRVLEIGTGTGWSAALLSWRLGAANVTTIEIDEQVAAQAAGNLDRVGYTPHVIIADGAAGCPDRAPYDRVHVTCGVEHVPSAWIEQTRPGGRIVLPWMPGNPVGYQMHLDVLGEGIATGRLYAPANYMMLRSQRKSRVWNPHHAEAAAGTTTRLDPREIDRAGRAAELVIVTGVPGIGWSPVPEDDGSFSLLLFEAGDPQGSWAECDYEPGRSDFEVVQYGPRRLWDEVSAAYLHWVGLGRPTLDRFGLTITPEGQRLWLDNPYGIVTAPT